MTIAAGLPFFSRDFSNAEALATHLTQCLGPATAADALVPGDDTRGLSRLLYRCPDCRSMLPTDDLPFSGCPDCGADFELLGGGQVRFGRMKAPNLHSLAKRCAFPVALRDGDTPGSIPPPGASWLAGRGRARQLPSPGQAAAPEWQRPKAVELTLTESQLEIAAGPQRASVNLARVSSVTTEGNDRVRLTSDSPELTWELCPVGSSALAWQDVLCLAVTRARGRPPNRT